MDESLTPLLLSEFLVYFIGVITSGAIWLIHLALRWAWPGAEMARVHRNLAKIGYAWIPDSKVIVLRGQDGIQKRNLLIVMGLLSILSWLGVPLTLAAVLSLRRLKSPREKEVLSSDLAKHENLTNEELERLVRKLK